KVALLPQDRPQSGEGALEERVGVGNDGADRQRTLTCPTAGCRTVVQLANGCHDPLQALPAYRARALVDHVGHRGQRHACPPRHVAHGDSHGTRSSTAKFELPQSYTGPNCCTLRTAGEPCSSLMFTHSGCWEDGGAEPGKPRTAFGLSPLLVSNQKRFIGPIRGTMTELSWDCIRHPMAR